MTVMEHFAALTNLPLPRGEALCRLCAGEDEGCCRTDPDLTHLSFPLSEPEWRRLIPYAALATLAVPDQREAFRKEDADAEDEAARLALLPVLSPFTAALPPQGDQVCAREPNRTEFINAMHTLFPGERKHVAALFPSGGTHGSLRTRADGACVFLGSCGCRLPREVRPWYCLLFPAWVIEKNVTLFTAEDCLLARQARGPAHGLALLGLCPAKARELHAALRQDWGLPR